MSLVGKTITQVRKMTRQELQREHWEVSPNESPFVIVLDDGTRIYASRDEEGNGPGCLFGMNNFNDGITFKREDLETPGQSPHGRA